jgi:hypothetical protein
MPRCPETIDPTLWSESWSFGLIVCYKGATDCDATKLHQDNLCLCPRPIAEMPQIAPL